MSKLILWRANVLCMFSTFSFAWWATDWLRFFGPSQQPRIDVGFRNEVGVDAAGHAILTRLSKYEGTVGRRTWNAVSKYAQDLRGRKVKIAFFNSTPQGGGVALMRHALVRFLRLLDIDIKWWVITADGFIVATFDLCLGTFHGHDQKFSVLPRRITISCKVSTAQENIYPKSSRTLSQSGYMITRSAIGFPTMAPWRLAPRVVLM